MNKFIDLPFLEYFSYLWYKCIVKFMILLLFKNYTEDEMKKILAILLVSCVLASCVSSYEPDPSKPASQHQQS